MRKTLADFRAMKARGEPIVMLTAYDCPTARLEDEAGVDVILVGDSVGTNVLGYDSPQQVTVADMAHHLRAVKRGVRTAYVLGDMPYASYDTPAQALENARALLAAGADGVKLEDCVPGVVEHLKANSVEVCSHLGYVPQTQLRPAFQAKTAAQALQLLREAQEMERAGAAWLLFEMIPEEVARLATESASVPTIGIGSGRYTSGQVLVVLDLLGFTARDLRHNRRYETLGERSLSAMRAYVGDVRARAFPGPENTRAMAQDELRAMLSAIRA